MKRFLGREGGFSLVELMITVAVIGILSTIAAPNFKEMQLRSRRAEIPLNVAGIFTTEKAYYAAFDSYLVLPMMPREVTELDTKKVDWPDTAGAAWNALGWTPDGQIYGSYESVNAAAAALPTQTTAAIDRVTITGASDVDNDDDVAYYFIDSGLSEGMLGPEYYGYQNVY